MSSFFFIFGAHKFKHWWLLLMENRLMRSNRRIMVLLLFLVGWSVGLSNRAESCVSKIPYKLLSLSMLLCYVNVSLCVCARVRMLYAAESLCYFLLTHSRYTKYKFWFCDSFRCIVECKKKAKTTRRKKNKSDSKYI